MARGWYAKSQEGSSKASPNRLRVQEFKTFADHHSYCILHIDTVSDPKPKEYNNDPGMKNLTTEQVIEDNAG